MSELNPYAAPEAPGPAPDLDDMPVFLAGRGTRLGAAIIDAIVVSVVNVPLQFAIGIFDDFPNVELPLEQLAVSTAIGFSVWFAIQGYFLTQGQTVGKRMLSIRMVDRHTNRPPSLGRLVGLRYLPTTAIGLIPGIGSLLIIVDVLFIFGSEKRCIHDHIAGTKVITT